MRYIILLLYIQVLYSQEFNLIINETKIAIIVDEEKRLVPQADVGSIPVSGKTAKLIGKDGNSVDVTLVNPLSSAIFKGTCLVESVPSADVVKRSDKASEIIIGKSPIRRFVLQLGYPSKDPPK